MAGPASFCYDANGNLTADGSSVFLYDPENRLVEKRAQTNSSCSALSYAGALQASLRYDPMGRLYEVVSGAATTRFLHDGDALVAEYDGAGTLLRRYVHGADLKSDDPIAWYEGASFTAATERFLRPDWQGSVVLVTDTTGAGLIALNAYDEYGIPKATNQGRFQYTGQAWIAELGMFYYKARIYSPTLGRFLQTDPIGYEDQVNLYAYVGLDPVNAVDPTGLQKKYEDEPLPERLINQAIGAKEQAEGAIDAADAAAATPGNMAQDAASEAVPDSIYQTDRERQGIDGDYSLYPDYPQLPEVNKVVNSEIVHATKQGIERGVFDDSSAARGAFSDLKSGITENGAWPRGTVYDRDGGGSIRPNSVLVPVGNGGYAVYRVRSNGTAVLRTTLNRRP